MDSMIRMDPCEKKNGSGSATLDITIISMHTHGLCNQHNHVHEYTWFNNHNHVYECTCYKNHDHALNTLGITIIIIHINLQYNHDAHENTILFVQMI